MFNGKVALVTGGVQGIGLEYAKELLRNGIRGLSLVDIKTDVGQQAEKDLNDEFGLKRVIFLQADITQQHQFKDVFKRSFDHWKGLDIVINNAALINETDWDKCILVNCMSTVHGTYLGLEYMGELKGGNGGVILNTASTAGLEVCCPVPTYSATKSFIISFTRCLGQDAYYKHNKVRILSICPGATQTPILNNYSRSNLSNICPDIDKQLKLTLSNHKVQPATHVAKCAMIIIDKGENGSIWVIEEEKPAYEVQEATKTLLRKA